MSKLQERLEAACADMGFEGPDAVQDFLFFVHGQQLCVVTEEEKKVLDACRRVGSALIDGVAKAELACREALK